MANTGSGARWSTSAINNRHQNDRQRAARSLPKAILAVIATHCQRKSSAQPLSPLGAMTPPSSRISNNLRHLGGSLVPLRREVTVVRALPASGLTDHNHERSVLFLQHFRRTTTHQPMRRIHHLIFKVLLSQAVRRMKAISGKAIVAVIEISSWLSTDQNHLPHHALAGVDQQMSLIGYQRRA